MKRVDRLFLGSGIQIDEEVAATDKIKTRKWRITQKIVWRKHTHVAHALVYPKIAISFGKKRWMRLGETVSNSCLVYAPMRALLIAFSLRSVAKI